MNKTYISADEFIGKALGLGSAKIGSSINHIFHIIFSIYPCATPNVIIHLHIYYFFNSAGACPLSSGFILVISVRVVDSA